MHISEGFLPLEWAIFWYLACLPVIYVGMRETKRLFAERPEQKLTLAVSGAFIFVLSSLKLPLPSGTSSHPTGTGLSAVLYGPSITAVLAAIVLVFQALLMAHGGITTLGADVFSMGIAGPAVAYFSFIIMRKIRLGVGPSFFAAAVLSDWVTYLVTSVQLALAHPGANLLNSFLAFAAIFSPQIVVAFAEGMLLWIFFDSLAASRPKLVSACLGTDLAQPKSSGGLAYMAALLAVVLIFASSFIINPTASFAGADDAAKAAISSANKDYVPWAMPLWQPPRETESMLFALQAAIGGGIIGFFIGHEYARKRFGQTENK